MLDDCGKTRPQDIDYIITHSRVIAKTFRSSNPTRLTISNLNFSSLISSWQDLCQHDEFSS